MSEKTTVKGKKPPGMHGAPKGRRMRKPTHICKGVCKHLCGEAGGRTKDGRDCTRPGGWGVKGRKQWSLYLCKDHDPEVKGPNVSGLESREALFVTLYCGKWNCNATQAAQEAGYGSTYNSSAAQGSVLLNRLKIKEAISQYWKERAIPAEEITKRMSDNARVEQDAMTGLTTFDADGRPMLNLTPETMARYGHLIQEIETSPHTGRVTKVKLLPGVKLSQSALRDAARVQGLYKEGEVNIHLHLQDLPDDEIRNRLREKEARLWPDRVGSQPSGNGRKNGGGG